MPGLNHSAIAQLCVLGWNVSLFCAVRVGPHMRSSKSKNIHIIVVSFCLKEIKHKLMTSMGDDIISCMASVEIPYPSVVYGMFYKCHV